MLNNTSLSRWHRAMARNLDAQFQQDIMQGMNCAPFVAEAICTKVHEVYGPLMETTNAVKPGQVRVSVIDATVAPNIPLAHAKQRLVTLTIDAGAADRQVRARGDVRAVRRQRLVRICEEAFQQGGLLTLEGIADLFNCATRTLVSDLAALRAQGIIPPLRSTVKDMGRALTHRRQIVARWLAGNEYSDIARATYHSVEAVANYVEKFKRCAALHAAAFSVEDIALIVRMSPALVQVYQDLLREAQPVPVRQAELDALMKKNSRRRSRQEVQP